MYACVYYCYTMTTRCGPRRRRLSSSARASAARGARCARGAEPRLGTLRSPVSRARSHRTTIRREIGDLLFVIPRLRLHLGRVQHALELQQRRHREEQHGKGKHEDVHLIVRVRVEVRPQERASATTDEVVVVDGDEGERAPHDRERAARGRLPRTRTNGDAVEAVSNRSSGRSGIPVGRAIPVGDGLDARSMGSCIVKYDARRYYSRRVLTTAYTPRSRGRDSMESRTPQPSRVDG